MPMGRLSRLRGVKPERQCGRHGVSAQLCSIGVFLYLRGLTDGAVMWQPGRTLPW